MLQGTTYKAESPIGKVYVTINHGESGQPFEVFVNGGKAGSDVMAMADALGRMISFVLRIHSPVPARERMREIVSELTGIGGARSVGFGENRVRSLPDAVAKVLARHSAFRVNGKVEDKLPVEPVAADTAPVTNGNATNGNGHANGNGVSLKAADSMPALPSEEAVAMQQPLSLGVAVPPPSTGSSTNLFDICPECGSGTLAYEEGCKKCYSCGYSEC
jgi:ribonucleoside-diphosphate reductase alpha chain